MTNGNHPIVPLQDQGFPSSETVIEEHTLIGLTKREYFAALAMQGLLVNYNLNGMYGNSIGYPMVEQAAIRQADALIKALNETP